MSACIVNFLNERYMKHKILHIITGLGRGGAEKNLLRLIRNDDTFTHCVVSLRGFGVYGDELLSMGVDVENLDFTPLKIFTSIKKLRSIVSNVRPNLISTWLVHADASSLLLRMCGFNIPIVWNIRHSRIRISQGIFLWFIYSITIKFSRVPSLISCCSHHIAKELTSQGVNREKILVIPNGIENSFILNNYLPKQRKIFKIGFVARWDRIKNHKTFFFALKEMYHKQNLIVYLIGEGITNNNLALMKILRSTKLECITKILPEMDCLKSFYDDIDMLVLPSYSEGFPNVLIEAMARGVPCLASNVGCNSEIIGDSGWLINPQNINSIAQAVLDAYFEFSNSGDEWGMRRIAALNRITQIYTFEIQINLYKSLWRKLVSKDGDSEFSLGWVG